MTTKYKSVRAVVFDAVGTLIYPDPSAAFVYCELGQQHGSKLSLDDIATNFGRALIQRPYKRQTNEQSERDRWREIVAEVLADLSDTESLFHELWNHFAQPTSWAVYEEVTDVLADLNAQGFTTAIASNFDDRLLSLAGELTALHRVKEIFVSSQVGYTKPSIEFFRAIEAKLRLTPQQLLMVGDDMTNDFEGAAQAGWHSLLLNRDSTESRLRTVRSLRDIEAYLL
ncbi:MAG: HAD-IA family hydrolase [Planctomycetes bacterium]|nr:HAD-IA family hydrolase [Planctomycetota bacterium]